MPFSGFNIPNEANASQASQVGLDTLELQVAFAAINGFGVATGCAVTPHGATMGVDVDAGSVIPGDASQITPAAAVSNLAIAAADSTQDRYDLVVAAYTTGAVSVLQGSNAAPADLTHPGPVWPAAFDATTYAVLAEVFVPHGTTTITSPLVIDKRPFPVTPLINTLIDQVHKLQAPPVPTNLSATANFQDITVSWSPSTGATQYHIFRDGSLLTTVFSINNSFLDRSVPVGSHTYAVSALNALAESAQTPPVSVVSSVAPPPATSPAIDASTPAATVIPHAATTVTSATFSPPAGSTIFLVCSMTAPSANVANSVSSVTDSLGSHLSWALVPGCRSNTVGTSNRGGVEIWWAACPNAQTNMTVTPTFASAMQGGTDPGGMILPIVVTGPPATPYGAVSTASNTANSGTPSVNVTTTANNSLVIGAVSAASATAPTAGTGQSVSINGNSTAKSNATNTSGFWAQTQNAITATSGTVVTTNDTVPTGISFNMVAVEILAGSTTPVAPTWTDNTLPNATNGIAYSNSVNASGNPTPTYAVTSGSLPTGLSLNATTGAVTGTPTVNGSYTSTITASNGVTPTISFRGRAETPSAGSNTSITINKPTGTVSGDQMLAFITTASNLTLGVPAGWTLLQSKTTGPFCYLYGLIAGPNEPASYTWSLPGSPLAAGEIVAFAGAQVESSTQADDAVGDNTWNAPSATAGSSTDWLVCWVAHNTSQLATLTAPAGMTLMAAGGLDYFGSAYKALAASGATGVQGFTSSITAANTGFTVLLQAQVATATNTIVVSAQAGTTFIQRMGLSFGYPTADGWHDGTNLLYDESILTKNVNYFLFWGGLPGGGYNTAGTQAKVSTEIGIINYLFGNVLKGSGKLAAQYTGGLKPVYTYGVLPSDFTLAQAAAFGTGSLGSMALDTYHTQIANAFIANAVPDPYVRLMHEMNGNWNPWFIGGTSDARATSFATYFARVVLLWRAAYTGKGLGTPKFIWCPSSSFSMNPSVHAFPGATYVDFVGLDFYDTNAGVSKTGTGVYDTWTNPTQAFNNESTTSFQLWTLQSTAAFATSVGLPVMLGEWSCWGDITNPSVGGGDDPTFVQLMHDWIMNSANNVAFHLQFNDSSNPDNAILGSNMPNAKAKLVSLV